MRRFSGQVNGKVDDKGRIILPAKFREGLDPDDKEVFVAAKGLTGCVAIYTKGRWGLILERFDSAPWAQPEALRVSRVLASQAEDAPHDKQGRMRIPQPLLDQAGIKREVTIIGANNRIEVWAQEKWQEYLEESEKLFEKDAPRLFTQS